MNTIPVFGDAKNPKLFPLTKVSALRWAWWLFYRRLCCCPEGRLQRLRDFWYGWTKGRADYFYSKLREVEPQP